MHRLMNSVVVPRPIAWVSTLSIDGVENLAPHSYFTVASAVPAILQFTSVGHNDSLTNAVDTGEFVISLSSRPMFEQINATGTGYPAEISEFEAVGVNSDDCQNRLVISELPRVEFGWCEGLWRIERVGIAAGE